MNRKIFLIFAWFLFMGCSKEEPLKFSGHDKNWLVVNDSEDPTDHRIYQIYKDSGIPIFYRDTIGSESRVTITGFEYTYYEVLKVFYDPGITAGGILKGSYEMVKDEDKGQLSSILDYIGDRLLPNLPKSFYFPSILLVNNITYSSNLPAPNIHMGFNTVVLNNVLDYAKMNDVEKSNYELKILITLITNNLYEKNLSWLTSNLYQLSIEKSTFSNIYTDENTTSWGTLNGKYCSKLASKPKATYELFQSLGFIKEGGTGKSNITTPINLRIPKRTEDLQHFTEACLSRTEADFTEEFKTNPVVLRKYQNTRKKIQEMGFVLK